MTTPTHSDKTLLKWYRQFNREWFQDSLPHDVMLCWEPDAEGLDGACLNLRREDGKPIDEFLIKIDPRFHTLNDFARLVLLHEMCHIKLWPIVSHGKKFQAEMLRLANMGAFKNLW